MDINKSNDLVIENGDFVIENGDLKTNDLVITNIDLYYTLAKNSLNKGISIEAKYKLEIAQLHNHIKGMWNIQLRDYLQQYFTPTVIFSALCIESLINYYAANRLNRDIFLKFEKESTLRKYWLFPMFSLSLGQEHVIDLETEKAIKEVFNLRNTLVHFKANTTQVNQFSNLKTTISKGKAKECLDAVKKACTYLCLIDVDFKFDFDSHVENDRYPDSLFIPTEKNMTDELFSSHSLK